MHNKIKDFVPTDNPNKTTPVFMGHGDADPTVRYEWGQMTAKVLQGMGWAVDFRTYKYVNFGFSILANLWMIANARRIGGSSILRTQRK